MDAHLLLQPTSAPMRTCLICAALWVVLAGVVAAQSPIELADGRHAESPSDAAAWSEPVLPPQASEAARAYWQAQDPSYEEDLRVFDAAEGAFTRPGAEQQAVLYLMSLWPRCCPKMGLAVVEDGRLVRNVAFEGVAQELTAVPDLDDDGHDELVYVGEFGMGGQTSRSLTLVSFGDAGLTERGGASIYNGTCATGRPEASAEASRILALPGPTFTVERYTLPSCEASTWEPMGAPEPLELYEPGIVYVDLPVE